MGANIISHLYSSNMEMSINYLIRSIKYKSKYRIHYETIDRNLLTFINRVTNKVVKDYYKDLFIQFKDYSRKLAFLNMG